MTSLRSPFLALAAAVALACASAAPAGAYTLIGDGWSGGTITYHASTPRYAAAVDAAAREWNAAGLGVRFRKAPAASAAVRIRYGGRECEGLADLRFGRRRSSADVQLGRGCDTRLIRLVAVHELGHVLGLGHERDRCARMNPTFDDSGTPDGCRRRSLAAWLERPLLDDDLRGARALHGRAR